MPYCTVAKPGEGLYKEKGSKFLGFALSCKDEAEVKRLVDSLRKTHPGACHVCYAFKLGYEGKIYRASDDGEPNNSAGQPILGQINASGATQVLVAVVRYYGGTKLGVGGLIQAYRSAAKLALDDAGIVEQDVMDQFRVHCNYDKLPILMKEIKQRNLQIINQTLDLNCEIELKMKTELSAAWRDFLEYQNLQFSQI